MFKRGATNEILNNSTINDSAHSCHYSLECFPRTSQPEFMHLAEVMRGLGIILYRQKPLMSATPPLARQWWTLAGPRRR